MDYLTELYTNNIKSGDVVAFKQPKSLLDKWIKFWTGDYYHIGILYVDPKTKDVSIYEAKYTGVCVNTFGGGYIPFDLIQTNVNFDADVKSYADSLIGSRYSWINFFLVALHLNSDKFGFICSTLVGSILAAANDKFDTSGMTPSQLVTDLLTKGCKVITIDSFGPK